MTPGASSASFSPGGVPPAFRTFQKNRSNSQSPPSVGRVGLRGVVMRWGGSLKLLLSRCRLVLQFIADVPGHPKLLEPRFLAAFASVFLRFDTTDFGRQS